MADKQQYKQKRKETNQRFTIPTRNQTLITAKNFVSNRRNYIRTSMKKH